MGSISTQGRLALLGALAALTVLVMASSASAVTLKGIWAPFDRCPVDNAQMLATDGAKADASCIASTSPNGSIKLGKTTATTGTTNLQIGAVIDDATGNFALHSPAGGALIADPATVPGGLLGLMCPSSVPLVSSVCALITNSSLNKVTATVKPAGNPSNFNRLAGFAEGVPIVDIPVKIALSNPFLASTCTIGTDSKPIILRPRNLEPPGLQAAIGDLDGTFNATGLLARITTTAKQGDPTFAVPGASNCGLFGLIDAAVNLQQGLPSPAGNNSLVLNNGASAIITEGGQGAITGKQFRDGWYSAILP